MSKFKNHVTSGNRPSIPANTPQVLKDMMERCWGKVPTQRPKFEELIIENNWSKIITDAVTHGQEEAEGVWKTFGKKDEIPKTVPWLEFVRGFSKFLEVPNKTAPDLDKTIEWKCLGAILEVNVDKTMPNVVTHESFVRFLSWFGPVRTGPTEGVAFLKQFVNLLQQEWFHGNIDEKEAEKRLVSDSRKKEALFLLRFSTSIFTYSMTFRKKSKGSSVEHERLKKENWTDIASLINYIEKERKTRRLQPCNYGRTYYEHLFVKEMVSLYNVDAVTTPPTPSKKS